MADLARIMQTPKGGSEFNENRYRAERNTVTTGKVVDQPLDSQKRTFSNWPEQLEDGKLAPRTMDTPEAEVPTPG